MSEQFAETESGHHRARNIAILSIILVSPIGAPTLAWILAFATNGGDNEFLLPFFRYVSYLMLPIMYFGAFALIIWFLVGAVIFALLVGTIVQSIWFAIMDRV